MRQQHWPPMSCFQVRHSSWPVGHPGMRLGAVLVFLAMYSRGRFAVCHDTGHARRVTKLLRESSYRLAVSA